MSKAVTVRPLGSFERAQHLTGRRFPYNLVAVADLEGSLPASRLRQALDLLQRETPLLRARIEGDERNAVFRLCDTSPLPLREVPAGDWKLRVEEELVTPFEAAGGPLARCLWADRPAAADKAGGELLLTFHHAIADGVGVGHLLRRLLVLCATDRAPDAAGEKGLPPSADERFPPRFHGVAGRAAGLGFLLRQAADELSYRWRRRRRPAPPPPAPWRCRVLTVGLSSGETAALVRASRRHRVSLTAVLEAAMLLAVARCRYGGERLPQRYFTFPLLRPHLEPPIDDDVFGSYLSTMRFTLAVGGEEGLWPLAARVGGQVYQAAKRGEKFYASMWSPLSMKTILAQTSQRMGTTAVSYTGPISFADLSAAAAGLRVRDVHAFVSNFPLGPEYTAQARIHRGRLIWDVVYLDADMAAEEAVEIATRMCRLLVEAAPDPEQER